MGLRTMSKRPYIGVLFKCCNVYGRAYLNQKQNAFTASCPRCLSPVRIGVSPTGNKSRFFSAG
ncbi:MAG: hypothetical protein CME19_01825 [Gemmatimonadetes bacterium]|nr:hypothetical protein [Gemmatimonadota bacterium]